MTSAEHSSLNPATSDIEVAAVLERNPLLSLTLGVLSTADSMKPSDVQQFIIDAANEQVSEDGDHEPTHDTSEILNACANLQQAGLVMLNQAESEEEPRITLTPTGQTVGLAVAKDIMKNYIDRGHGINRVEHKTPLQGPGVIGMIALGAVGIVGKVAEVVDDGMQEISEGVRKRVQHALRTRPLPKPRPPVKPVSGPPGPPPPASSKRSRPLGSPPDWLGSPPKASSPAATGSKAQPQTEAPKFTSKVVVPPLRAQIHGLGVRVPAEYNREVHPRSSLDDRPTKGADTAGGPDNPESTPSDKADQNTPGSENSFKPDAPPSTGSQDPQNGGSTSGGPGPSGSKNSPREPTGQPAGSSTPTPTQKPDGDKEKAPANQGKPDDKSSRKPETPPQSQPKVGGGGRPVSGSKNPRTPSRNTPSGGGSSGSGAGTGGSGSAGGSGGSSGGGSSASGGEGGSASGDSTLEQVKATLLAAETKTDASLDSMRVALERAIEEKELLTFARDNLQAQPIESINPLNLAPADTVFLASVPRINFGARLARLEESIQGMKDKMGEMTALSSAIHNIAGQL